MQGWEELTLFLYIIARMSGCVFCNPVLGRKTIPSVFKSGIVLVLSVFVYSITEQTVSTPGSIVELAVRLLLELMVGLLLGLIMEFFFYIPQLAGLVIDTQMGMTMNQIYDAGAQANLSVTSVLLNAMMTLLFFAANGHQTLLRIMLTSGDVVRFGAVAFGDAVYGAGLELFVQCTVLAVKLCLPVLAAELLGQLGMGVLMKMIPQINVFAINIELKVLIGLVMLLMLVMPFSEFLLQTESDMLTALHELLALVG